MATEQTKDMMASSFHAERVCWAHAVSLSYVTRSLVSLLAVLQFAGCGSRFDVKLDPSDSVTYQIGSGVVGSDWMEVTFLGDGAIKYHHIHTYAGIKPQKETVETYKISVEETKQLFQSLVDNGLFDLKSNVASGADIRLTVVSANIDGHKLRIKWNAIKGLDKKYAMVNNEIRKPLERIGVKDTW